MGNDSKGKSRGKNVSPLCVKSSFKILLRMAVNILIAALLGTVLLTGVYCLPVHSVDDNVKSSAVVFQEEGKYPNLFSWCHSRLDNFTDAIMLLEAADDTDASAFNKAMLAYRGVIAGKSPTDTLVDHYVNSADFTSFYTYPRYWHGYQVLLKPLLEVTNYQSIRTINGIVQFLLIVFTFCLMVRRKMTGYVIPYLLSYLMLMPVALAKSMQFSSCFYIFTIGIIVLLLFKDKINNKFAIFLFLNIGIATAFFDYLTYPIATFGIPMVLYLGICSDKKWKEKIIISINSLLCWGIGYAGMWSSKWIIGSLTTDQNVIKNALEAFTLRSSHTSVDGNTSYSILDCEIENITTFFTTPFTFLVLAFVCIMILKIIITKRLTFAGVCNLLIPYILIAALPLLWYAFTTNHSTIHFWFTNKACVVFVLALMCGFAELGKTISNKKQLSK